MNVRRPVLTLLASGVLALVAVALAAQWVGERGQMATDTVVVAVRELPSGTRLAPQMLRTIDWPAGHRPERSFAEPQALVGRVLVSALNKDEPVLEGRLAAPGERGGLSAVLSDGKRAMTVKVSEIVGVAGFALPGNYVDLLVHAVDEQNRPLSRIVLERILVLAVAQDASTSDTKPRVGNTVTLEVTPQQAEQVDLARSVGSISLVLRNQADTQTVATPGARRDFLLGAPLLSTPLGTPRGGAGQSPVRRTVTTGQGTPSINTEATLVSGKTSASRAATADVDAADDAVEVIRGLARSSD